MSNHAPRVYLAGPDVFLPQPWQRGAQLKAICAEIGLEGVFPLDGSEPGAEIPSAAEISAANEAHIRGCDAVLANLTPFRGTSADAGTLYEVGFARALGKLVVAYTHEVMPYDERCRLADPATGADGPDWRDGEGLLIERFGLPENLMIPCGIESGGGAMLRFDISGPERWTDLTGARAAAAMLAAKLRG